MRRWELYLEIFMELIIGAFVLFSIIFLLPKALGFMWPFVAGWIIAMLANPLRKFLERKIKLHRKFGSALIIIIALTIIVGALYFLGARLMSEISRFANDIPAIAEQAVDTFGELVIWAREELLKLGLSNNMLVRIEETLLALQGEISTWVKGIGSNGMRYAGNFAKGVTNGLVATIVMILSAYFFMVEKDDLMARIRERTSPQMKEKGKLIKANIFQALGGYMKAQVKIMGMIFVILLIGLFIAREEYAFLLAILICFLDVLPFFGTGTALIPWAIFKGFDGDLRKSLILIVIYVICLVSRQIVQPKIIGDSVGLQPLPTLILMYVGLRLGGLSGFIFAMLLGIIFMNLYKIGMFDQWISRIRRRIDLLKELE